MMRIISGTARGTKLKTLEGDNTRPTLERVKEALFSMIQFDIANAHVLDLFAGSGQLALESLSRGAASADLVDKSSDAVRVINENVKKTHFESKARVYCKDFKAFLSSVRAKYDLVFLDPPYAADMLFPALDIIVKEDLLSDDAVVVCEIAADDRQCEEKLISVMQKGFSLRKNNVYAKSRLLIFDRIFDKEEGENAE